MCFESKELIPCYNYGNNQNTFMADLKKLLKLDGVLAAGEFSSEGELVAYEGELNRELAESMCIISAATLLMLKAQAYNFSRASGMPGFESITGFSFSSRQLSICVRGNIGVFVKIEDASYDEIFRELNSMMR